MLTKKWWQSKTMWLNIGAIFSTISIGAADYFSKGTLQNMGVHNPGIVATGIGIVAGLLNMKLRKSGQNTVISTLPAGSMAPGKTVKMTYTGPPIK